MRQYSSSVVRVQKVFKFSGIAVLYSLRGVYRLNRKLHVRMVDCNFAPPEIMPALWLQSALRRPLAVPYYKRTVRENVIRDRNILIPLYE